MQQNVEGCMALRLEILDKNVLRNALDVLQIQFFILGNLMLKY